MSWKRGANPESRNRALVRVLMLWRLIEGRPRCQPVRRLADRLGCSYRTTYRDLRALEDAGYPVPPRFNEDGNRI